MATVTPTDGRHHRRGGVGGAECRTAAVAALSRSGVAASDWTEVYGGLGTAVTAAGSSRLDGTVALVHSRSFQCSSSARLEVRRR